MQENYDPTREDNILGRNKTRLALLEGHLKDPIVALDKALKCVETSYEGSRPVCLVEGESRNGPSWPPWTFVGKKADLGGRLALLGSDGKCVFAHSIHGVECATEVRAARRALFLPDYEGASDNAWQ